MILIGTFRRGRFAVLEQLGRGAFGAVYKARDPQLQRLVAVKVPRTGWFATAEEEERFSEYPWNKDDEYLKLLREAETLIEGKPQPGKRRQRSTPSWPDWFV